MAKGSDGVTGASLGSEAAKGADGNCEMNLRGEVPATDAVGVEVKPDPPAGVAGLAVDHGMGKPEKLDSGTGIVADIQKCRATKQTGAAGMEGLPAALGKLRMFGWEGFSIIFIFHRYPMLFVLFNTPMASTRGSDWMVSRPRVAHQRMGGGVLERNLISACI